MRGLMKYSEKKPPKICLELSETTQLQKWGQPEIHVLFVFPSFLSLYIEKLDDLFMGQQLTKIALQFLNT